MTDKIEDIKQDTEQEQRQKFLDSRKMNRETRGDIFENYTIKNSYEMELPNTKNKLVVTLHSKKTENNSYLLKLKIGNANLFFDAKISFIVAEALRFLTDDIVPDDLKPTADIVKPETGV